jgi:hypothetical protein
VPKDGVCDVCRLVNEDYSSKLVGYCPKCDAWICEYHRDRWTLRMIAALKERLSYAQKQA